MRKNHCRLPYNYLTNSSSYPDKIAATLGKSEMTFTFTLTDNMMLSHYDKLTGIRTGTYENRTSDISQDKGYDYIPLVDNRARLLPGQTSVAETRKDDPIIN
jgi:hypothetical protein